ncbi:MAG: tRNA dihydrouridine synthase DusB [Cyanobacteriota bacterium]|nr:tRNA dihydrouridine synthase DusB [Cyanobacteriota bacterium]
MIPSAAALAPPPWTGPLGLEGRGCPRSLHCRVMQSPLAGVSDRIFRALVRRWAPEALLFTEMVQATGLEQGQGRERLEALAEEGGPIGVQLFDHRPAAMAEAARRAEAAGAFLIDINMGCPVRKVARKGGGSGLIRDPDLAARVVEAVAATVSIPVTVKTRLAWHGMAPDADRTAAAIAWCLRLREAGAQLLTLHGHSREQGFAGEADWSAIAAVKRALPLPLIANGDIRSPADALRCLAITGADGVMVGRGSLGAPWRVGQIAAALEGRPPPPPPRPEERLALAAEHLQALLAERGDHGLLVARKHLGWACADLPGGPELRRALLQAPSPQEALAVLARAEERWRQGNTSGQL